MNNITITKVLIDKIDVSTNPRKITKKDVTELTASIKRVGIQVPIAVRISGDGYELICGGRRVEAAKQNKLKDIPALVYSSDTPDSEIVNMTHFENCYRQNLKPMDEARSVKKIYEQCGTYSDTAMILGKTPQQVAMCVNVLKGLSKSWAKEFRKKSSDYEPTLAHMELLARLSDEVQERLFETTNDWEFNHLRDFKHICSKEQRCLSEAPWDIEEHCNECAKRTDVLQTLFEAVGTGKAGQCLDKDCWSGQYADHISRLLSAAKEKHGDIRYGTDGYIIYSEKKSIQDAYGKCIALCNTEKAKKSEDGAFALFIVAGKKIGKIMWRKFPKGKKASSEGTGKGPKTLKERRDELNRKRWSFVNVTLVKLLSGDWDVTQLKYADKVTAVMYLVSCFGVRTFESNKIEDIDKTLNAKEVQAAMTDKLFEMVQGTFMHDLEWRGPITQIPDSMIKLTSLVANIFVIDIVPYFEEAKLEYKEPKSWANLKADGTPKK